MRNIVVMPREKEEKVTVFFKLQMPTTEKGKPFISPRSKFPLRREKVSAKIGKQPGGSALGSNGGICGGNMVKSVAVIGVFMGECTNTP
jgi:hypothetical protein